MTTELVSCGHYLSTEFINKQTGVFKCPECGTKIDDFVIDYRDKSLTHFEFSENVNWSKIRIVNLYDNQLTSFTIPNTLTSLKELSLSYNQLTSLILPETLISLQYINLSYNKLTSFIIPETLTSLRELC